MPRLARLDAPGILHHVMGRGIVRKEIFINDADRSDFIVQLTAQCEEGDMDIHAWIPRQAERHVEILEGLLIDLNITANLVPDAHLAALAIEHGLILCSADGDFGRFPNLKWQNPIS